MSLEQEACPKRYDKDWLCGGELWRQPVQAMPLHDMSLVVIRGDIGGEGLGEVLVAGCEIDILSDAGSSVALVGINGDFGGPLALTGASRLLNGDFGGPLALRAASMEDLVVIDGDLGVPLALRGTSDVI